MAVAAYTTDLTVIVDMDGTTGTAAEPATVWTAGRSPINDDTDFTIEGTNHASLTFNATGKGGVVVTGGTRTWTSGDYLFGWINFIAPKAIVTKALGGLAMLCGDSITDLKVFYVGGSDFGSYPYGGWQNFAVNPEDTADETLGTSPTDFYVVGAGGNVSPTKVNKGNPLGFDVFRYGRGEIRIVGGTSTDDDATFLGMATVNDGTSARWGLFQAVEGGYKWKGLMYFGYGNPTNFTDSNKNIVVDNVDQVASTFNRIEIHNASSVINWTNISISSLSSVSPGQLEMMDDATFNDTGGVFTDMDTFIYQSNATITGRTYRRCGLVTQGGGIFDGSTFEESTVAVALLVDDLDDIDNCNFISDGTGHAMELTSAHVDGTFTLTDCIYTDYATVTGTTGNEVIYNNSGGAVTINIDGGDTPTYRNGVDASTNIIAEYTHTVTGLESGTEVTYVTAGTSIELFHVENAATGDGDGKYQVTYTHSGGASVDILIHHVDYKPDISNIIGITLPNVNTIVKVTMFYDENYYNPA